MATALPAGSTPKVTSEDKFTSLSMGLWVPSHAVKDQSWIKPMRSPSPPPDELEESRCNCPWASLVQTALMLSLIVVNILAVTNVLPSVTTLAYTNASIVGVYALTTCLTAANGNVKCTAIAFLISSFVLNGCTFASFFSPAIHQLAITAFFWSVGFCFTSETCRSDK